MQQNVKINVRRNAKTRRNGWFSFISALIRYVKNYSPKYDKTACHRFTSKGDSLEKKKK